MRERSTMNSTIAHVHTALDGVLEAARELFAIDGSVRSVGVGMVGATAGYVAVRNAGLPSAFAARTALRHRPDNVAGLPVRFVDSAGEPRSLARVPHSGPASPGIGSLVPEQQRHRPLVAGLQVQNFDDDLRNGQIASGFMIVGTLGCFVTTGDGRLALLSNNHVVAGENDGLRNHDRILQPGAATFSQNELVATLADFVDLRASPVGATIVDGTAILNVVDAGLAVLEERVPYRQAYLPIRSASPPRAAGNATIGDKVHKVGRTTGLTFGTVTQVGTVVGPVPYRPGPCWFQGSIVIEGENGATFSDHGDSGSTIVRDDGTVVGLLFAGNGVQTYACPIGDVLRLLRCRID